MVDAERLEVLESLTTVTTGDIHDRSFDPGEVRSASDPYLPNVRLANGSVPPARRRTLMLGFNSPFFPEVLIASAVMARSEEHTSELQSLMRISYAGFRLKKKKQNKRQQKIKRLRTGEVKDRTRANNKKHQVPQ